MGYSGSMKIYTRTGDKGQTSLFSGARVSKNHGRVNAYGTLDELNSYLGICLSLSKKDSKLASVSDWIENTQRNLFALGSWLASPEACANLARGMDAFPGARSSRTTLNDATIEALEKTIDEWESALQPMQSFILPGGHEIAAHVHFARTLCRRAERCGVELQESGELVPELAIRYLNRLADALFVLARFINHTLATEETPWN